MLLVEFIRSYLKSLRGNIFAIILKSRGNLVNEIVLYDVLDLIDQVESGNKRPIPKILGTALIDRSEIVEINGDSRIEYFAKKYASKESGMSEFIGNHYSLLNFLRKKDAKVSSEYFR